MTHATSRRRPTSAYTSALRAAAVSLETLEPRTLFSAAPTPAQLVAQANNAFAFDLLHELGKTNSGNMFFSPYSISTALEMTLQGANGTTASEIIQTLHLPSNEIAQAGIQALYQLFQADPATAGYTLSTANRLWVNDNFQLLNSFLTSTQNLFGAGAQSIDYSDPAAAAATINQWVSDQTHGKIQNLIPAGDIQPFTELVLTNAIYFKGDWATAFNANLTHDSFFQSSPTQIAADQMMEQTGEFGYYQQSGPNGFQAVDLPYQGNNLDMLVILPSDSTLDNFQSALTPDLFSQITSNLTTANINVNLPKFELNGTYNLKDSLSDLGIHAAFTDGADFSGIASTPLKISFVIHKSFIQVDENGTEAAAATGIGTVLATAVSTSPTPFFTFNADHPFLFAIRDRATNTILFLGQVTNPANASLTNGTIPITTDPVTMPITQPIVVNPGDPIRIPPIQIQLPLGTPILVSPTDPTTPSAPIATIPITSTTPTSSQPRPTITYTSHATRGRVITIAHHTSPATHPTTVKTTSHTSRPATHPPLARSNKLSLEGRMNADLS